MRCAVLEDLSGSLKSSVCPRPLIAEGLVTHDNFLLLSWATNSLKSVNATHKSGVWWFGCASLWRE